MRLAIWEVLAMPDGPPTLGGARFCSKAQAVWRECSAARPRNDCLSCSYMARMLNSESGGGDDRIQRYCRAQRGWLCEASHRPPQTHGSDAGTADSVKGPGTTEAPALKPGSTGGSPGEPAATSGRVG